MLDANQTSSTADLDAVMTRQTQTGLATFIGQQAFWVFLAAALAALTLGLVTDSFATPQNLFNVTRNFAFVAIVALGMTVVIISGGIDLSVGSVLCLSAMILAIQMNAGQSFWVASAMALAAALLVGLINGILIAVVGMPSFVVTLGMLSVARSLAMVLSDNKMIFQFGPDETLLFWVGGGSTFGLPHPVVALTLLALLTGFLLNWTRWGVHVFAIGANERAATMTGIRVPLTKISVFMFSSLMAGVAGVLMAGWLGGVTTNLGQSLELTVIAAAVIGGANLMGGAGTVFGAVVGAALIEIIRNSLILLGVSTFWQGAFVGTFIVLAVAFDRIRAYRNS
ncbi:ABC transporter permease [Neogemmobacter tilapiae]|uniref:Ribose ABC transporter permease n=1 Tax=Neogemmobacter tilapiae TaxID=875041 RepID=A0A918TM14_9RHOB|nr:ABC transporter permease [Gemmobacter tilapiae]GHC54156.1 ribose ABC transporter permease [Gemmobacter tilapiae]